MTLSVDQVTPMLAESAPQPFSRPGWLFELKYDGYRLLSGANGGRARLLTRRRTDATADYPRVAKALLQIGRDLIVDGELVVLDDQGRSNFNRLQLGEP